MPTFARDLRLAARQLFGSPGFSITVVLTFALGIGATTVIFSLVEAILLRPLPFANPERLVMLGEHIGSSVHTAVAARDIDAYTRGTRAFSSLGGYGTFSYELSGSELPEQVDAGMLNPGVFTTLGVQPERGRVFTAHEEDAHQPVAVISYPLWQNRYHSDPGILGSSIVLDRKTYSIIGVMPLGFEFPLGRGSLHPVQLWIPLSLTPEQVSEHEAGNFRYQMIARLENGVSLRQAADDADRVSRQIMANYPASMAAIHIRGDVTPLRDFFVADMRPVLRTLFLAVTMVLLVACVNVAGLLLVRSIRRRRHYAVRLAMGARPAAVVRESILEGLLLSGAGALLGLSCVAVAIRSAPHFLPQSMPRVEAIGINPSVAGFAILLALATGTLCSLAPAFAALRTNLIDSLKESSKAASGASSHAWLRNALVVAEIASALILVNTSLAFVRSYQKMIWVDPGFRPDHVLVAGYQLPISQYTTDASVQLFNQQLLRKVNARPGVIAAGIGNTIPGSGLIGGSSYTIEGEPESQWKLKFAMFFIIDGDYLQAMRIRLLEGRVFTAEDRADSPPVIIVNESMAKHCWPGQSAIGKRIHPGNPKKNVPWATIVGVVANTKGGARDEPDGDQWYTSEKQPVALYGNGYKENLTSPAGGFIVLRSTFQPDQMIKTLRTAVAEVDPRLALEPVQSMEDVLESNESPRRFNTDLISAFAFAALLLSLTGIYAVLAFSVSMRAQEIAIRLALGAQRGHIARLVLASGVKLGVAGCSLGILGSWAAARLVQSFLFGVRATDPRIALLGASVVLILVLLAAAMPAARAAGADPARALRAI